jgi:MerR family transcriptional regulator, light-induced transcriptional regulator
MASLFSQFATESIYNMKAVSQRTGIPAPTLRAWERRHKALAPGRSSGNYRLYSERDIAMLLWLDEKTKTGLSISRAVALLERVLAGGDGSPAPALASERMQNLPRLSASFGDSLMTLDETAAGAVLAEAFALYPLEDVCEGVIAPALARIGEAWHAGAISIATEHFATSYVLGRLLGLLNAQPVGAGPLILAGCAPGERHEIGVLMLALSLRRAGNNTRYLGGDVPLADWARAIQEFQPRVVAISAMTARVAETLDGLGPLLAGLSPARLPRIVLGGVGFRETGLALPGLPAELLDGNLRTSVARIRELLGA